MKFDCNPKYTIPYVKVCDNVYLTKWAMSSTAHPASPVNLLWLSSLGRITSSSALAPFQQHTTLQFFTLQPYAFASIFVLQVLTVF